MAGLFARLQSGVISQLPGLIEKSEPQIESALRTAIQKMAGHPDEAKLFHDNWSKLNTVVDEELSKITKPVPVSAGKRKSSKRTRRHVRK
jgi:hypothetical protein